MNFLKRILKKKNVHNNSKKDKEVVRVFYGKDNLEKISIIKNGEGSYTYEYEKYYYFDEEEKKILSEEGYWCVSSNGFGSFFASEELVLNELREKLKDYHELKDK